MIRSHAIQLLIMVCTAAVVLLAHRTESLSWSKDTHDRLTGRDEQLSSGNVRLKRRQPTPPSEKHSHHQIQSVADRVKQAADQLRSDTLLKDLRQPSSQTEYNRYDHVQKSNMLKWEKPLYEYEDPDDVAYEDSQEEEPEEIQQVSQPRFSSYTSRNDSKQPPYNYSVTQEQHMSRTRAKNLRLWSIQFYIISRFGAKQQSNVSSIRNTLSNKMVLNKYYESYWEDEHGGRAHRYKYSSPLCEIPNTRHSSWSDPDYFRLYFNAEGPEEHPLVNFRLSSAVLRLFKKGPTECPSCHEQSENTEPVPLTKHHHSGRSSHRQRGGGGGAGGHTKEDKTRRKGKDKGGKKKNANSSKRGRYVPRPRSSSVTAVGGGISSDPSKDLRVTVLSYKKAIKKNKKIRKQKEKFVDVARDYIGWVEIDIRSLVRRWMKRPEKNFGLEIHVEDSDRNPINTFDVFETMNCSTDAYNDVIYLDLASLGDGVLKNKTQYDMNLTIPNLELSFAESDKNVERRKRHASPACKRENYFLDFAESDLSNYVLAPQGVEVGFCSGHCKPDHVPTGNQENVSDNNKNVEGYMNVFKNCCAPTKYKPFRFLHYDEDNKLTVSVIEDLIVSECGCRQ